MPSHKGKQKRKHRDEAHDASSHESKTLRKKAKTGAVVEEPMDITPQVVKSTVSIVAASDPPSRASKSTEPSTMHSEPPVTATIDVDFRMRYLCGSSPTTPLYRDTVSEILAMYLPVSALEDISINRLLSEIQVQEEKSGYTIPKKRMVKITNVVQNELVAVVTHILGKLCETPSQLAAAIATLKSHASSIEDEPDALKDATGDVQEQTKAFPEREGLEHTALSPDIPRLRVTTSPAKVRISLQEPNAKTNSTAPQDLPVVKSEPKETTKHFWSDNSSTDGSEKQVRDISPAPTQNVAKNPYPILSLLAGKSDWPRWQETTQEDWQQMGEEIQNAFISRTKSFKVVAYEVLQGGIVKVRKPPRHFSWMLKRPNGSTRGKMEGHIRAWAVRNLHAFPELAGQASLEQFIQPDSFPACDSFVDPEENLKWKDRENVAWTVVSNLRAYKAKNDRYPWVVQPPFDHDHILLHEWGRDVMAISQEDWSQYRVRWVFEPLLRKLIVQNRVHFM